LSILNPNTNDLDSFFAKAKYLMAWRITLVSSVIFLILSILSIQNISALSIYSGLLLFSIISLIYLKITKKFNVLYWLYITCGTLVVHYSLNAVPNFTHFVDFLWIIVIILIAFICLGKQIGLLFSIINIIGIICFYLFSLNTHIASLQPLSPDHLVIAIIEILMCMFSLGYLLHQYIVFNDYFSDKLKKSNSELLKKNDENIILVKEIHHRVKNNLQIIISLLRLQKGELKSDEAKRHFNEAINRIMVMSLIHKKLYQKVDMAQIEVQPYLYDLSKDVIEISNMGYPIDFEVNSEIKKIGLKTIVPLGLLINELLSNSIKHAFRKDGYISISILKGSTTNEFVLVYADDGNWKEKKEENQSFGLGLIQTLSEQLEGNYQRQQSEYTFELKNLDH
jgi:two-component sensor histidine kinase